VDPFSAAAKLAGTFNLSSGLISQLAVVALKARLADQHSVECDVTARPSDLLLGRVGPVTVTGRNWRSGLGLTCRAIEATVESCELDARRVLSERKLVLTTPSRGTALIALSAHDFGNFITHPRVRPSAVPASRPDASFRFLKDGVHINATSGVVSFISELEGRRYHCILKRGGSASAANADGRRALVVVRPVEEVEDNDNDMLHGAARKLESGLGKFFSEMVFELDGTFLSFRDLMVTDRGGSPSVILSLGIQVHKLPSRRLAF
jgi:hypothetical protein